jgi:sugar phosphate isomerase/epimerase
MSIYRYHPKITCAYLYTISKYGYPPDISRTGLHIKEMAEKGFRSIELEGIGRQNIEYLYQHKEEVADQLNLYECTLPVLCLVLPQLSAVDKEKHREGLELFDMGCELAHYLGAPAVLDNGPLINLVPADGGPIKRHYPDDRLVKGLPKNFEWDVYWQDLVATYQQACCTASKFDLAYHLHPCEGSLITGTDSFLHFAAAVGSSNLLFNLDTANQFYFKDNLALSVLRLAGKISYIHLSDNNGSRVEHLVPGDGRVHWDLFFQALQKVGYKGGFAIDVGGDETGIRDIDSAYTRSAAWLTEQINHYSFH